MTIPEDMMAFIEETARKAAREGAKEVVAEQARKAAGRCDRRLRNTKLLLKNYRMFKKHCTGAVYTDEMKRESMTEARKKPHWNCWT